MNTLRDFNATAPPRFVTASPRHFDYGSFLIKAVIARRNDKAIFTDIGF
jgi:hypothetical protein